MHGYYAVIRFQSLVVSLLEEESFSFKSVSISFTNSWLVIIVQSSMASFSCSSVCSCMVSLGSREKVTLLWVVRCDSSDVLDSQLEMLVLPQSEITEVVEDSRCSLFLLQWDVMLDNSRTFSPERLLITETRCARNPRLWGCTIPRYTL